MSKKDFRFWLTFIILIGLSCEGAFYYKHHMIVKTRAAAAQEAAQQRAAQLAAGPITSKKVSRQDFPIILEATGTISPNASDPTYADINFSLPEENFDDIEEGQQLTFVVDEIPDVFFKGEIYQIDDNINRETHSFNLKGMVNNPDDKLQSDMTAYLKLVTDIHQNALVIPESAIITKDDKDYVYVIEKGNAKAVPVKIDNHSDDIAEVSEGLIDGQDILVSGTDHISDGAPVILEKPSEEN